MARSLSSAHARLALALVVGCATACTVLLKDKPLPCTTDADCAKYTGSRCDIQNLVCVSGDPGLPDASGPDTSQPGHDSSLPDAGDDGDTSVSEAGDDGSIDAPIDQQVEAGAPTAPDWNKAKTFLQNLYDDGQQLVRRAPGDNTYHLTNDNALAMRAFAYFPIPDMDKANAITARLKGLHVCGCGDTFGHTADINHMMDVLTQPKGSVENLNVPFIPNNPCFGKPSQLPSSNACAAGYDAGGAVVCSAANLTTEDHATYGWGADTCQPTTCVGAQSIGFDTMGKTSGAADLIALEIINYVNHGKDATALWTNLQGKYDGIGVFDQYTSGGFSTYKLALYRLAARAMGQPVPASVDLILAASQSHATGGIRSQYNFAGDFSLATDQVGDAEATAFTIFAYLMPDADL